MDTRREFIRKAALLSGGMGIWSSFPASVQRALEINPAKGSSYLDAEHIVILMQENRSFDHCFGCLQGVRGFNDPRVIKLPNKNLAWLQQNKFGEAFIPFRLDLKDSRATWMGSLPHSWPDQVDARNSGRYDQWLISKASSATGFENAPLSLGYYNREDIPFYYSLADAFTVCDQNFSSSLTGTTANRLFLWTGTIRSMQDKESMAHVSNSDVDYDKEVDWISFPERLEEHGISWKVYQNEISLDSGLSKEEDDWLTNFTDNPLEWFSQYRVRFSRSHYEYLQELESSLPAELDELEKQLEKTEPNTQEAGKIKEKIKEKLSLMLKVADRHRWAPENFYRLNQQERNFHLKAFCNNSGDPGYRKLTTLKYQDGDEQREMKIPMGDILHQFRADVHGGVLPKVSWVIGPKNFSDHPGAPWYGAWYVSEVLDILTKNPDLWKKTIFILCYDENDGYFDHIPPFVAPDPHRPDTGLVSPGIDTGLEYVTLKQDKERTGDADARESPIGLGYRVPLIIASPWSRGGYVCSQVFDHTSILQLLEKVLSHQTKKTILEPNISAWRRTVCGDLGAVFRPYNGERISYPLRVNKDENFKNIHRSQFKSPPSGYKPLQQPEVEAFNKNPYSFHRMPMQERGTRLSTALPYQLNAGGELSPDRKSISMFLESRKEIFGDKTAGSPFAAYADLGTDVAIRNYAVSAGDKVKDSWLLSEFREKHYRISIYGPNGFFRELHGDENDPLIDMQVDYSRNKRGDRRLTGNLIIQCRNRDSTNDHLVRIKDHAYGKKELVFKLARSGVTRSQATKIFNLKKSFGWYDFSIRIRDAEKFERRFAGHVETGQISRTDPYMGNPV